MFSNQMASQDFDRAIWRAFWRKILTRLRGESNELLPFDEVREKLPIRGQHYTGLQQVPIDKIVGSLGRYQDFDRAFLPIQTRTKSRWISIDKAHYEQVSLPPVELFKIGDIYFVKDGNHRVSVARERGQEFVDAYVIEIDIPVILTPDTRVDDLHLKREYAEFLLATDLKKARPEAEIELSIPNQYRRLLEHIAVHRWYLGEQRGSEVTFQEAAVSWYDNVYQLMVNLIREQGLLTEFPGSTEADLYLWIMEYQGYLRHTEDDERGDGSKAKAEAARVLLKDYPLPAVKKLVNVLTRTTWIDHMILQYERANFLKETGLGELYLGSRFETSVLGQYDVLREHIAVHRWYLGEQRHGEVPYQEAVISWYNNIYKPIVDIFTDQGVLDKFPGRTRTDLYLWVIRHKDYLQAMYGSDIPLEQAAEQFVQGSQGQVDSFSTGDSSQEKVD